MSETPSRALIRQSIGGLLTLLSDAEAQRQYERNVGIANVPAELLCMWFDDLYCPEDDGFRSAFSVTELDTLARFNAEYEAAAAEMRPLPPSVVELQDLPAWGRVVRAADKARLAAGPMAVSYELVDGSCTLLWDFGWFDVSNFRVVGVTQPTLPAEALISSFFRAPIAERSLCTPAQWGEPCNGLHGPFALSNFKESWISPLSHDELARRIDAILTDPEFAYQPSSEQRQPVESWLAAVTAAGDSPFALEIPSDAKTDVAHIVWTIYHEFLCLSADRRRLTVAVFGMD